jgi:predicted ester cyclase
MTGFVRRFARPLVLVCWGVALAGCASEKTAMDSSTLNQFATRYTAAWCSQHAASVASFFEEQGSLKINDGAPAIGRPAITNSAQSFMTAFPDIVVKMDRLVVNGANTEYHWTLTGTNTGPGGTGSFVRFSGFEEWRFGPDGLIAESLGHFDESDYRRQLNAGGQRP